MDKNYATSRLIITGDRPSVRYEISPSVMYNYVYMESFSLPVIWNNIPDFDIIFVDGAAVSHTIPIEAGSYSIETLVDYIVSQMDILYPAGAPYTPDYFNSWEIQSTAGEFSLSASSPLAAQRMGLIGVVSSSAGLLLSQLYNMSPTNINIRTNIPIYSQSLSYDNLTPPGIDVISNVKSGSNFFASLAINTDFSQTADRTPTLNQGAFGTHHKLAHVGINSIDISISDELGMPIDIYPQRWTLVLVFYTSTDTPY